MSDSVTLQVKFSVKISCPVEAKKLTRAKRLLQRMAKANRAMKELGTQKGDLHHFADVVEHVEGLINILRRARATGGAPDE